MPLELSSPAFKNNEFIPAKHTCSGANVSPELRWSNAPAKTVSFALVMDDPDAPAGTWVHWVLYDIPAGQTRLEEGLPKKETLENGARQGRSYGVEHFSDRGYSGPCPPPGKPHRYLFKFYALDKMLGLAPKSTTVFDLEKAMQGDILERAQLIGLFKR